MLSRSFRSKGGGTKRVRITRRGKMQWGGGFKRKKKKRSFQTEPELVAVLGQGPEFVRTVYKRYRRHFAKLDNEPKRCSAYLNMIAGVRMLDGSLWTDKATESMLRRVLSKTERRKKT